MMISCRFSPPSPCYSCMNSTTRATPLVVPFTTALPSSSSFLHSPSRSQSPSRGSYKLRKTSPPRGWIEDYWGGDLLGFDLDDWSKDVEDYGSIAVYAPAEGGYEGRYAVRLKAEGYHFLDITARGLGDPEAYLSKVHGIRPAHLGKEALECFYVPPEVDYRLAALPKSAKGLVVWIMEAKVLSKTELQYLALLPALRKNVKVIAECGTWRKYRWKPLREVAGLPVMKTSETSEVEKKPAALQSQVEEKKKPSGKAVV